ncbi:MAG: serpin family protein, partial [Agathobacter sp.]|nr:serpin family protein [Agathobacter sp.]
EFGKDEKNILISPTSVLYALGMTSFGARGETLSQMEKVFGTSRGELNRYLSEEINNNSNELKVANSIWFTDDERFTVKPEFFQFNKDFFQVDIFESSFDEETVKDINAWVESKTDGTIKEALDKIPENVVMYLVNAMLFEAEWADKYTESAIHDGFFTTYDGVEQQVEMMHGVERLYLEDENASGFMKYYKNKKYAFVALLPKENISVYEYAKSLTGEHLEEMLSNPQEVKVYSQIPQFSCDYSVDMQQILKNMGMVDLFDVYKANLEGIGVYEGRNIYVGRVIHKTFIEVTPVGTKAGAATLVELPTYGAAPEPEEVKEVHLDRPFIYMIIDCENNQPVFIGAINSIE